MSDPLVLGSRYRPNRVRSPVSGRNVTGPPVTCYSCLRSEFRHVRFFPVTFQNIYAQCTILVVDPFGNYPHSDTLSPKTFKLNNPFLLSY